MAVLNPLYEQVKKTISIAVGNHRLSFSEWQTMCFEAASLANERQIGIKPGNYSEHSYLCPNDLLLGRTRKLSAEPWDENKNIAKRFYIIHGIIDLLWKKLTLCYLPNLITLPKWHVEKRNIKVGDIVIIMEKYMPHGQWKLEKVVSVVPGIDNKVHRISIAYKHENSNTFITIDRPV